MKTTNLTMYQKKVNVFSAIKLLCFGFIISILTSTYALAIDDTTFTYINTSIIGIDNSSLQWGDYDNDNDLDLLLTGNKDGTSTGNVSIIYQNIGSNTFTDINAGLQGVSSGSSAWGDYDNDGDLDIIITGTTNNGGTGTVSIIYNNNNGVFTDINAGIPGVYFSSVCWGDYDNDNDLDILLSGTTNGSSNNCITKIYQNNNNTFTEIDAGLTGTYYGSVEWGDYDNDNDLDILLTGNGQYSSDLITKIYRNDLNNTFTDISADLTNLQYSTATWGDYNNDGYLDVLLSGKTSAYSSDYASKVFKNNSGNSFTDINAGLTDFFTCKVAWGDYDSDGDLDILLTGKKDAYNSRTITKIYRNDTPQDAGFIDINVDIDSVARSSCTWGDYNNDGKLDIIISGYDGLGRITKIYQNKSQNSNTLPNAPANINAQFNTNRIEFSWNTSTDNETPSAGISYNMFVKKQANDTFIISPMADTITGFRKLFVSGGLKDTTVITYGLPKGSYSCGVQAVDNSFVGSGFSKTTFTITNNAPTTPELLLPENNKPLTVDSVCLKWHSTDYDGDAVFYNVYIGNVNNLSVYAERITADSIWIKNLQEGTIYQWQIKAYDSNNDTATSIINAFKILNSEQEPNNSYSTANCTQNATGFYGVVGNSTDEVDYLCINYPKHGLFSVTVKNRNPLELSNGGLTTVIIYNKDYSEIGSISSGYLEAGEIYTTQNMLLKANQNYYVKIRPSNINDYVPYYVSFNVDTTLIYDCLEPNASFETAYTLYADSLYASVGFCNDTEDWYAIKFNDVGIFKIKVTNPTWLSDFGSGLSSVSVYNSQMQSVANISNYSIDDGESAESESIGVAAGQTYFVNIKPGNNISAADYIIEITSNVQVTHNYELPTVPIPVNINNEDASILPSDTVLQWYSSHPQNLPITYNFNYGNTLPPSTVEKGLTLSEFKIENINWDDTVYWQVTAFAQSYDSVVSPIYSFSSRYLVKTDIELAGVYSSNVNWGDYDNDGDLDVLVTGIQYSVGSVSKLYRNDGNEVFTLINAGLQNVSSGSSAWGDYDNDGDLDILLTGTTNGYATGVTTKIYQNDGSDTFTDISTTLPAIYLGSVAWVDYNNDGYLDICLSGTTDGTYVNSITKLYKNNKNSTFTEIDAELPKLYLSSMGWGDYDNDGDVDVLLIGKNGTSTSNRYSGLFKNNLDGTFTKIDNNIISAYNGSVEWGDYDNDGDLDVLLTGSLGYSSRITRVYRNDNNNIFTSVNPEVPYLVNSSSSWGDYDNDGNLDILLTGNNGNSNISKVYKNTHNDTFTDINAGFLGVYEGDACWGDYDNDNDLDLIITGKNGTKGLTKIYKNNIFIKNTPPVPPTNLYSVLSNNGFILGWNSGTDTQTDLLGLSYNLLVYNESNNMLTGSMADTLTGLRRVAMAGKIKTNSFIFDTTGMQPGIYHWKVQAIDASLSGGAWSNTQSIEIYSGAVPAITLISPAADSNGVLPNNTELQWSGSHPNGETLTYNVYFGTNKDNPKLVSNNQSATTFVLSNLNYNSIYYWRVEVTDQAGKKVSSPIQKFTTKINEAPVLSIVTPQNDSVLNSSAINLVWSCYDAEDETLTYTILIIPQYDDTVFVTNYSDTVLTIDTLSYNKTYFWKIIANDTYGNMTESETYHFRVGNNYPPTITLITPANGSSFRTPEFDLIWQAFNDEDEALFYDILITSNSDDTVEILNYADTFFHIKTDTLVFEATYYWKVKVTDAYGQATDSYRWQFTIKNAPPEINLVTPANDSTNAPLSVKLIWEAFDAEGDALTYNLYFSTSSSPQIYATNLTDTFFTVEPLLPSKKYYWKVVAKDQHGDSTISYVRYFSTFENNSPQVYLISPINNSNNIPFNTTLRWNATDSDGDDLTTTVFYFQQYTTDTVFFNNITGDTLRISDLKHGTTYKWKVIVVDEYGNVSESSLWSFRTAQTNIGWLRVKTIGYNSEALSDVKIEFRSDDYVGWEHTDYTGKTEYVELPINSYKLFASKEGYFSAVKYNIEPELFDSSEVIIQMSKIGDFNNDSIINRIDLDSLVSNWHTDNPAFEMGPATGTLPNLTVNPDGVFDFEDVMVFCIIWDYYNNNNKSLSFNPINIPKPNTTNNISIRGECIVEKENPDIIKLKLLLYGLSEMKSSCVQIKYNVNELEFISTKKNISNKYNDITFVQHNSNNGLIKISAALLNVNIVDVEPDFVTITFKQKVPKVQLPDVYYEINSTSNVVSAGKAIINEPKAEILVYPNPANNFVYIQTNNQNIPNNIVVTDILGKILLEYVPNSSFSKIDISHIATDILFIHIKSGNSIVTKKVIKNHNNGK